MEGLSEALGFSFALMMGTGGRYWKIYMGGDENYQLMLPEEIIELSQTVGSDPSVASQLRDAFNTSSVYLWDVDDSKVTMMTLGSMSSAVDKRREELSKAMNPKNNKDNGEISTDFTKNKDPDRSKPFWNRMFDFLIK